MKKIALILAALMLLLAMVGCNNTPADTSDSGSDTSDTPSSQKPVDKDIIYYERGTFELDRAPFVDDQGRLVLYFKDGKIDFDENTKCYIGMISGYSANSVMATPDITAYADMAHSEGGYIGIALVPAEPLPAGSYEMTVEIQTDASYNTSFELEIK